MKRMHQFYNVIWPYNLYYGDNTWCNIIIMAIYIEIWSSQETNWWLIIGGIILIQIIESRYTVDELRQYWHLLTTIKANFKGLGTSIIKISFIQMFGIKVH